MEENRSWRAQWVWMESKEPGRQSVTAGVASGTAGVGGQGNELVYFRRSFQLGSTAGMQLSLDVSADSRYRLYMNGHSICTGPARGDLRTHYYETVDLAPYLQAGTNTLAIKVLHYAAGSPRPSAVPSAPTGALLVEGSVRDSQGNEVERLDTGAGGWRCLQDAAIRFLPESYTCVGGGEEVDGSLLPHGWQLPVYSDDGWQHVHALGLAYWENDGFLQPWQLASRTIPFMFERERDFVRTMRASRDGIAMEHPASAASEGGSAWLYVAANRTVEIELDAGELTTGFLQLATSGGAGSRIHFLCSECYQAPDGTKGMRDEPEGQVLHGYTECYMPAGLAEEEYETFLFRTFRFVRLEVATGNEPLAILRASYRETGYPLDVRGTFAASDASLAPLWEVSVRTLQRCMHEGYYDCPFYEQLQYSMDTRLQALFTYPISGDGRLARKAIYEFHSSLQPSGMLLSRYPSIQPQVIPGFALYWIMMVHDYLMYAGDLAHAAFYRPTIDAVLAWFERRVGTDGLVGAAPRAYWSYVDWVKEWEPTRGAPDASGPLAVYNLMYAKALQAAADVNRRTGRAETAAEYEARASRITAAVNRSCWSEAHGLYRDGPQLGTYSQHAQIWAILAGAVQGERAKQLSDRLLDDPALLQVSYSMGFFLFRALATAGNYGRSFALWDRWRQQIALHLTTWLEDPVTQRSECHAWGAVPLYEFTSEILGVKPLEPGFAKIGIAPQPGPLAWASGTVMAGEAAIEVSWRVDGKGSFELAVAGLDGREAEIRLPDGTVHIVSQTGEAIFACMLEHDHMEVN